MKTVAFSIAAGKEFQKLPADAKAQIMAKLDRYAETGAGDVKALKGRDEFRLRVGDYRVLFFETEIAIQVVGLGHRRDIYR